MAQKTVAEYRSMVRREACGKTIQWAGGWGSVIFLFLSCIVTYIVQKPKTWRDIGGNEVLMVAFLFFCICFGVYLSYLSREPVFIHNTQEVTIDNLSSRLKDLENRKPVIVARNPKVLPKRVGNEERLSISVEVLNITPDTTAEKVLPTVRFLTTRGKCESERHGRWLVSTDDLKVMRDYEKQAMDLLSNGTIYPLHFARQSPDPKFFYAYYREANGKDGYDKLYDDVYRVKISFRANNNV